ncbi:MAG: leucyl aminopeptidase [Gammaproteobacteria bacterium]|nr:leucyl aminopeptidase [Gammaproteobacteria bacterium]
MQYSVVSGSISTRKTACLVAAVYQGGELPDATRAIDKTTRGAIAKHIRGSAFDGKHGDHLLLFDPAGLKAERLLLVGVGEKKTLDLAALRKAVRASVKALADAGIGEATSLLTTLKPAGFNVEAVARATVEASEHAAYRFERMKSKQSSRAPAPRKIALHVATSTQLAPARRGVNTGGAVGLGVALARDLGNLPANVCTPSYLASEARKMARKYASLKVKVLGETDIKRLGMGDFWGVARGSSQPPRLILFEYSGGRKSEQPVALVGKGVTFDAGGISLKPPARMDEMKFDMCGAASVFGTLKVACEMKLPMNIVGITPATENLPDGNAVKPGDILTSLSGQTVEVLNTDAEGRLILSDALTYVGRYKPRVVVDMATLTGACVVALGHHASGLMSPDDKLAEDLLAAGERAGDRAWRLPLWDDYQSELDSNFADFANVGGREGGAITAGCFLWRFAKDYKWAHLDIAGTAWDSGAKKGATGRPVGLLCEWLLNLKK